MSTASKVVHITLEEALQETWDTRLALMSQVSCNCLGTRKDGFTTDLIPYPFVRSGVHAACRLPTAPVLAQLIEECCSCERWYIITKVPDNMYLCSGCE